MRRGLSPGPIQKGHRDLTCGRRGGRSGWIIEVTIDSVQITPVCSFGGLEGARRAAGSTLHLTMTRGKSL